MTRSLVLAAALGLVLAAGSAGAADDDAEMKAAQEDLRSALSHLKAANHDYKGHRKTAVQAVDHALGEVAQGLKAESKTDTKQEKRTEHRENRLENRKAHIDDRLNRLQQREKGMEDDE